MYDVLGDLYLTRLSGLMGSKADSRHIVKPLSKTKGADTEKLILFFGWLGVFYLLAGGCQWHGAKFCMAS